METATTFKLGVFPFTNDPANFNGNGVNGPCWSRDADNHQGFSTGPLAATVDDASERPGRAGRLERDWVGTNETTTDHAYAGGRLQRSRSRSRWRCCRRRSTRASMGLNITPYDNDNTAAAGTTTLRHIDNSTRLAWSASGSVQSDPYRWGHATLPGYTPPAGRPTTPTHAERLAAEPRTASTRRRRSGSRRTTACRSPAARRPRPTTSIAIAGRRPDRVGGDDRHHG